MPVQGARRSQFDYRQLKLRVCEFTVGLLQQSEPVTPVPRHSVAYQAQACGQARRDPPKNCPVNQTLINPYKVMFPKLTNILVAWQDSIG